MDERDLQALIDAFNATWNDHDLDAALALVTDDCVFESTGPAPDGEPHVGKDGLRAAWEGIFANTSSRFEVEDAFTAGDRHVQQWRYDWGDGHVRGIDVFRVRDGRIAEKLSYVKG